MITLDNLHLATWVVGTVGTPYYMWGGPIPQSIGKAVIHTAWAGTIAANLFRSAMPEETRRISEIKHVAIQAIFYSGSLFFYNLSAPYCSLQRSAIVCIGGICIYKLLQLALDPKKGLKANWKRHLCEVGSDASLALSYGSLAAGIASLPVFKKV